MKKTIAAAVSVVAIAAAVPLVASAGADWRDNDRGKGYERGGHHEMRGEHRGNRHGGRRAELRFRDMLETYDADGDGAVAQEEIDAWRESRLREFDGDGDGQLSLDEYQALWLDAMRERMVDQFQEHDDDGDGQVTVDEFGEPTANVVLMRDRNRDGVLNLDDTRRGRDRGPRGDRPAAPAAGETNEGEQQ